MGADFAPVDRIGLTLSPDKTGQRGFLYDKNLIAFLTFYHEPSYFIRMITHVVSMYLIIEIYERSTFLQTLSTIS